MEMVNWLTEHGVSTKTEEDLRMFPTTDSSQTIINCFLDLSRKQGVQIHTGTACSQLVRRDGLWIVKTKEGSFEADRVVFATGSATSSWKLLESLGLRISEVVPSLFTFNISDPRLQHLQGISFEGTTLKVAGTKLIEQGPLLITHRGLSGPAVLKLSAWGAYELHAKQYKFEVLINYLNIDAISARTQLTAYKEANPKRKVAKYPLFGLPRRFWEQMVQYVGITPEHLYGEISKKLFNKLLEELTQGRYHVDGKSNFKEEFVTAGGVDLSEIELETFECKRFPGLYLAGEVLNIDALTGGFNFQACWSAGWIISENITQ